MLHLVFYFLIGLFSSLMSARRIVIGLILRSSHDFNVSGMFVDTNIVVAYSIGLLVYVNW